jgi:hypothetical protein
MTDETQTGVLAEIRDVNLEPLGDLPDRDLTYTHVSADGVRSFVVRHRAQRRDGTSNACSAAGS